MKKGNISNQRIGGQIGFAGIDSLLKARFSLSLLFGKKKYVVDENIKRVINSLYWYTHHTVAIVFLYSEYRGNIGKLVEEQVMAGIHLMVPDLECIRKELISREMLLFVDENEERRKMINSPYAVSLSDAKIKMSEWKIKYAV